MKDLVSAAMGAVALPVAVGAEQHRGKAATVEQNQALLAAFDALGDGFDQRRREDGAFGLLAHVHHSYLGKAGRA